MTFVAVTVVVDLRRSHPQQGFASAQDLDLRLFIHAQPAVSINSGACESLPAHGNCDAFSELMTPSQKLIYLHQVFQFKISRRISL